MENELDQSLRLQDVAAWAQIAQFLVIFVPVSIVAIIGASWLGLLGKVESDIAWSQRFDGEAVTIVQFRNTGWLGTGQIDIRVSLPGTKLHTFHKGDDFGGSQEQVNVCEVDFLCVTLQGLPAGATRTIMVETSDLKSPAVTGTFLNYLGIAQAVDEADGTSSQQSIFLGYILITSTIGAFVLFREVAKQVYLHLYQ